MPLNRLIFVLVTVLALAGGTVALFVWFLGAGGPASLAQISILSVAVIALALGVRYYARRAQTGYDD